jgi:tetratricopeptide (TPR) repeat protein
LIIRYKRIEAKVIYRILTKLNTHEKGSLKFLKKIRNGGLLMLKLASRVKENRELIYARANVYLAKGCLDLAEELYFKLINLQKSGSCLDFNIHADILHNLGMLAERRGNFDQAIDYYQQSVNLNRERSMTWLFLAKLYLNRYDCFGNKSDLEIGLDAIKWAEDNHNQYPVIKVLKAKYALV